MNWNEKRPKPALSRFILSNEKLDHDDLVYVMLNKKGEDLGVNFIVPVSIPRVAYKKSIGELLDSDFHPCENFGKLCPACRLFGWVRDKSKVKDDINTKKYEINSYKSRLVFEHAVLKHMSGKLEDIPLAVLSSPKPTTVRSYLLPKKNLSAKINWAKVAYNGESKLRGRKFYRHHGEAKRDNYSPLDLKTDQNRTVRDVVLENSKFEFIIKFKNLAPVELGALLWSLELDSKGVHSLGYAKPLGFGSVRIQISGIQLIDPVKRYSSIKESGIVYLDEEEKNRYIQEYKDAMCRKYGRNKFENIDNIKDILILSSKPFDNMLVHYPRLTEKYDVDNPSYKWFVENENIVLPTTVEDNKGFLLNPKVNENYKKRRY